MQTVHNCCFEQIFLQQLNLEQLINMANKYKHPSAWIQVEQFSIFIFRLYQQSYKLLELKRKLEFREVMCNMTCMGGEIA